MTEAELIKKYFTVPRREIAYLRFTFEGYDGLMFMRTLRAADGLIEVAYPPSQKGDAEALLTALDAEIGLVPAAPPPAAEYEPI